MHAEAKTFFNRVTDRFVHASPGKRPLDVGADRIARTALAALEMLNRSRELTGAPLPLAWTPVEPVRPAAIEVYPAATLRAHGVDARGYEVAGASEARLATEGLIGRHLTTKPDFDAPAAIDDVLDAVLRVIAGLDSVGGAAEREGWIWVRERAGCTPT